MSNTILPDSAHRPNPAPSRASRLAHLAAIAAQTARAADDAARAANVARYDGSHPAYVERYLIAERVALAADQAVKNARD